MTFPTGMSPMKTSMTSTAHNPMTKAISDRALAAIAAMSALGTIACGIVAFWGAAAPNFQEEIQMPPAGMALRPIPIESESTPSAILAAIGQSVLRYCAAVHLTRDIGPLRLAIDTASALSIDIGLFGRPLATLRIEAVICEPASQPKSSDEPIDFELAVTTTPSVPGVFRLVSEAGDEVQPDEFTLTRAERWTRDGYCPAWPDSKEYSAPGGKRIFLDDMQITPPTVLVGEAAPVEATSDA